jgi:PAS domain S-box-containing protein
MEETQRTDEYRRLVDDAGSHAIFLLDTDGHVENWSGSARSLYGYEPEDVVGEPFSRLWAEPDGESESPPLVTLLEDALEEGVELGHWHRRADGDVFWAEYSLSPIWNGDLHGFAVISRDDTRNQQYERMLERQNDRLKEFTDILSHDLRTPLTVVDGRLALFQETGDERHLEEVEGTLARMERLIDDLLSVARQGAVVKEPKPTNIGAIVDEAAFGTLPDRATLEYEPVPELMADSERLQQVFENLFRNAVEHGGPEVVVRVGPMTDGFYVEDDGPGIPEADRSKVFDHGFTTREEGSGFGLSVVRTIAGSHGWDVRATAATTGGARFEFTGTGALG